MNQSDSSNLSVNTELVRRILNHFRSLQIFTILPTYNGDRDNPAEFLERLAKYFKKEHIAEDKKLCVTEDALQGRARAWFEARSSPYIDFIGIWKLIF